MIPLETVPAPLILRDPSYTRLDNPILQHSGRYPDDATTVSTADLLPRHPT